MLFGSCCNRRLHVQSRNVFLGQHRTSRTARHGCTAGPPHPGLFWTTREAGPKHKIAHVGESLEAPWFLSSPGSAAFPDSFIIHGAMRLTWLPLGVCLDIHSYQRVPALSPAPLSTVQALACRTRRPRSGSASAYSSSNPPGFGGRARGPMRLPGRKPAAGVSERASDAAERPLTTSNSL